MASFKAIVLWFPRERLPLVNGLFMSFGGLGALSATGPVELALGITDWRGVYAVVGFVTALVAAVILMISPDKPEARSSESVAHQIKGLFEVYRDKLFWRVAPVAIAGAGAGLAIQTLWVGPWLSDVAGLDRDTVAGHLTLVAAAMAAGMASMGIVADLAWQKFSIPPRRVFLAGSIIFLLVQLLLIAEFMQISLYLWMLFGFLSNFSAMAFAILSQHFPTKRSGVANTGMNLFVFAMAFALQYGIGAVIDSFPVTAAGTYSPEAFQTAFGVVAAIQVAAITWFLIAPRIIGRPEPLVD